jgi:ribose-phosphate pyrophosphokinase
MREIAMSRHAEAPDAVLLGSAPTTLLGALDERFADAVVHPHLEKLPDGEVLVSIGRSLRGRSAYVVHTLGSPVGEHLLQLALICDAARRAGAEELIALIPYLGYARHDRRAHEDEPLGAAVVARLLSTCSFSRVVTVDLHAPSIEGFFSCPLENVTAEPILAEVLLPFAENGVIVSPDLGAAKLARRYAARLGLPLAVVQKSRIGPRNVVAHEIVGDVRGKRPVIVDDLISTGATVVSALDSVLAAGALSEAVVAATHGVFAPGSEALQADERIRALVVTDSVEPITVGGRANLRQVALAPLLAEVMTRLIEKRSLAGLVGVA